MIEQQVTTHPQNNPELVRTEANVILKVVDQCIKAGLLDDAKSHLDKARIIDPTNAYIYAFQERIAFLKEEKEKKAAAQSKREDMEKAAREKIEESRRIAEEARLKKEAELAKQKLEAEKKKAEIKKNAEETPNKKDVINPEQTSISASTTAPVQTPKINSLAPPKEEQPMFEKIKEEVPRPKKIVPVQKPSVQQETPAQSPAQATDMYKRVLLLAWADGAVSPEEQSQLRDLRTTLRITAEEHNKLEQEAKEESYAHAFTLVWSSGMSNKERAAVINELRQKYQITAEQHSRIEAMVLAEFGEHQTKPLLYVIDDEENTLDMIVRVLEGGGFAVQAYNTSDEALVGLKTDTPAMIISDINLETSTIGGFSFYEKIRQLPHLSLVPFIFLSGMTDEGMVRYGKGLGVDDYITKPFSGDMLIDTVKGKLKRYKQLKNLEK